MLIALGFSKHAIHESNVQFLDTEETANLVHFKSNNTNGSNDYQASLPPHYLYYTYPFNATRVARIAIPDYPSLRRRINLSDTQLGKHALPNLLQEPATRFIHSLVFLLQARLEDILNREQTDTIRVSLEDLMNSEDDNKIYNYFRLAIASKLLSIDDPISLPDRTFLNQLHDAGIQKWLDQATLTFRGLTVHIDLDSEA